MDPERRVRVPDSRRPEPHPRSLQSSRSRPARGGPSLLIVLHVGGLVLLVASFAAAVFNGRLHDAGRPRAWRWLWSQRWPLGFLLGLLSFFSGYPVYGEGWRYGETSRTWIFGIPFMFGASDEQGLYPGLGGAALVGNFLFWLLIPQFVLWVTSGRRRTTAPETPIP